MLLWDLCDERLGVRELGQQVFVTRSVDLLSTGVDARYQIRSSTGRLRDASARAALAEPPRDVARDAGALRTDRQGRPRSRHPGRSDRCDGTPSPTSFGRTPQQANSTCSRSTTELPSRCWAVPSSRSTKGWRAATQVTGGVSPRSTTPTRTTSRIADADRRCGRRRARMHPGVSPRVAVVDVTGSRSSSLGSLRPTAERASTVRRASRGAADRLRDEIVQSSGYGDHGRHTVAIRDPRRPVTGRPTSCVVANAYPSERRCTATRSSTDGCAVPRGGDRRGGLLPPPAGHRAVLLRLRRCPGHRRWSC